MAGRQKRLSSAQFTRAIPKLSLREIERHIRQVKGRITDAQARAINQRGRKSVESQKGKITARAAVNRYRPRKGDRGKIIFIGSKGQRNPRRKGYTIYVTQTGKKWLLKSATGTPYRSQRKRDIELPLRRNLRRKQESFQKARLVQSAKGRQILRGRGNVKTQAGRDFQEAVVNKIATSLKRIIEGQASHRTFLIESNLLLRHSDGSTSATSFSVPIDKADHISIRLGGLKNFVAQKYYAYLARALQYMGFISSGSAAHIKRVTGKTVTEEIWNQYHSDAGHNVPGWAAPRFEVVTIEQIEWRISQAQ